jgi:hypothetical protein
VACDVMTDGPRAGRSVLTSNGRPVKAAVGVDADGFYAHCLETLRR